eukprot:4485772-Pyramimonas_sp.AAC.1
MLVRPRGVLSSTRCSRCRAASRPTRVRDGQGEGARPYLPVLAGLAGLSNAALHGHGGVGGRGVRCKNL